MGDIKGYGTKLQYGSTADHLTATWTDIATAKSIKPPKVSEKSIDTTHLESPDEMEEFLAGLGTAGELEASLKYDKTRTATLYGFWRVSKAFRILYPDGSGWKFNGHISEFGDDEVTNGDIVRQSVKFKVSGKPAHFTA